MLCNVQLNSKQKKHHVCNMFVAHCNGGDRVFIKKQIETHMQLQIVDGERDGDEHPDKETQRNFQLEMQMEKER